MQIDMQNVSYEYDEQTAVFAVKDMSFSVKKGEFVAVLGKNGSGKSTVAKLLDALYVPSDGKLLVCGMDTADENNTFSIRQRAGMVFQNPDNQMVATVVEEDVAFGLENLGVPSQEIRRRVDETLKTLRMDRYAKSAPHMLSGGQKQRIAIAGVVAMRPEIIIFDEPTAMLDPTGRKEVLETILTLNREFGITILLITHFMEEAAQSQRVLVMEEGELIMEGSPREVFAQVETMKRIGLDVPMPTELAWRLHKQGIDLPADILTSQEFIENICRLQSAT